MAKLDPANCVDVGSVDANGVWATKKAFARAAIPCYTDGKGYPDYRILVPQEYRTQARDALLKLEQRRWSPYAISHE